MADVEGATGSDVPHEPAGRAGDRVARWPRRLIPLLIVAATVTAFLPALSAEFVRWDDHINFLANQSYRGLGWSHLRWMFASSFTGHYTPVTWVTLGLDYLLWGMNPAGYHLTNLLLHAANAGLVYFIAVRLLDAARPAPRDGEWPLRLGGALAALLFAVHPLRVESVAWITERRDVLSGVFYLAALLAYLRFCETHQPREARGRRRWYWGSVGLFALALLSKAIAVSLPVILVILDIYPLRRLTPEVRGWLGPEVRRVWVEKIPYVILSMAAGAVALLAGIRDQNLTSAVKVGWLDRIAISFYGLAFYLWKSVWPSSLSPIYQLPPRLDPLAWPFLVSAVLVTAISGVAILCRRRAPALLAVWTAYVVTLLPVLGLVHFGPHIAADRNTYLATMGWAILGGAGLGMCWSARRQRRVSAWLPVLVTGLPASVVTAFGFATWNQSKVWHDTKTLWTHAVTVSPSPIAHTNMGFWLQNHDQLPDALAHFREALRINPERGPAHNNLANALAQQGQLPEAIAHYREAIRLRPEVHDFHNNLALALAQQGQLPEAIAEYREALRIHPDDAEIHVNLGLALTQQGQLPEAIAHYREALRIRPDDPDAHNNLGIALGRQGQLPEAVAQYLEALRLRPDDPDAHNNLGMALGRQGQLPEAVAQYLEALRVKPDHAEAHNNLGLVLANQGKLEEAAEHFRAAVRANPGSAQAHNNLGMALGQQGELPEAIAHFREAVRLRPSFAQAHNNLGITLAARGELREAAEHFRQALKIQPDFEAARQNLDRVLR